MPEPATYVVRAPMVWHWWCGWVFTGEGYIIRAEEVPHA